MENKKIKIAIDYLKRKQLFWYIMDKIAIFYPSFLFKKIPREIIVEPTNFCNLRCPVCPTSFAMKRERGFMSLGLFKNIIDEFKNIKNKPKILMNFAGEPLLNKDIDKFVKYASENGHETFISTNCTVLDKELSEKLIKAGLSSIHLCIDGITKESHEAYRVGSKFEVVKENIEIFLENKRKLNGKTFVSIQVLLTSFSENEIEKIKEWAEKIGADNINFKSLSLGSHTSEERKNEYKYLLPKKREYRRKISDINKTLCTAVLNTAVIYWNGDLGLCCIDYNNVVKMPNIKEKSFLKIYLSKEIIKKRKAGFRKKFILCKKCPLSNADFMGINVNFSKK